MADLIEAIWPSASDAEVIGQTEFAEVAANWGGREKGLFDKRKDY